jgi:hypothetical protein
VTTVEYSNNKYKLNEDSTWARNEAAYGNTFAMRDAAPFVFYFIFWAGGISLM